MARNRNRHNQNTSQRCPTSSHPNLTLEERLAELERKVAELKLRTTLTGNPSTASSGDGGIITFLDRACKLIILIIILLLIISKQGGT